MPVLNASTLTLDQVYQYLKFQEISYGAFKSLLQLEPLSEFEISELTQIRNDFKNYLNDGKVLEGMVMALTVMPLLRLAGFYRAPIKMRMEQEIDRINIEDEDISITGRLDLICINKNRPAINDIAFWILAIEAKNTSISASEGLPQLLTYAYKSLEQQKSLWGLTTNGVYYEFFYIQQNPQNVASPTYQPLPSLHLMEPESSEKLLQVLKAICKLQNSVGNLSAAI
ncbi:restriction endonuclease subunit R [Pseudanabaena minima]|uniref:restriction endonuclease subunit R n=1 Tax=Pseudanabaena minima TaxID=890415 RepID=UPI003DA920B0